MDLSQAVDWSREALRLALVLGAPLLAMALLAGILVAAIQTMTQLHEPTVALVPRLAVVGLATLFVLPWILSRVASFAAELIESIPGML